MMKNIFSKPGARLSPLDIDNVERELSIKIPQEVREHYLEVNGGIPQRPSWLDASGEEQVWIGAFLPMKYSTKHHDTIEDVYRTGLADNYLTKGLVPFALDVGGNFVCFNERGEIFHYLMDVWSKKRSDEENRKRATRPLTYSFTSFVNHLVEHKDG